MDFEPPPQVRVALVGGFLPRKGIDFSIPALNSLLKRNSNLDVGFLGPGVAARQIHERFEPSLHGRIAVVKTYRNAELPDILKDYHILLFPSLSEGFPLAPLECMACGLAAIVSDIPGIAERLQNGVNAILIPPRSQAAIETAVQRLIDDAGLLKRLRQSGYEVAQNYSWPRIASRTLQLYQLAMDAKARNIGR